MAIILDGKKLSTERAVVLKEVISTLSSTPTLVIIQIGDLQESNIYVERKINFGKSIGATVIYKKYAESVSEKEIINDIISYNTDTSIHGILVQLPIPKHIDTNNIIESIHPKKDVDGLTAQNVKKLTLDNTGIIPATTKGILTLLKHYSIALDGKHVAMIGRSSLVGKPTAFACINEDATVTLCHSHTTELKHIVQSADIIITATGQQNLITADMVLPKHTIIDVGIHIADILSKKIIGDVDFTHVAPLVHAISPVPGGVGPMTVLSLFENLVEAYKSFEK